MKLFGQAKTDGQLEATQSELMRLKGAYEFLEGQYRDAVSNAEIARKNEREAVKYLRELETMLVSYGERTVRLQDVENRSLKDRVVEIVQALNQMKTGYLDVIEQLRNQLSSTDQELRDASRVIEELTEIVEEQKVALRMKDDEARVFRDTIQSLQEMNVAYEEHLKKWDQYRIDMEAYIQHLTGQSEQQEQYGGLASYGETSGTNHLETKQSDEQKGNVNSSKLMMENRLRVLQPAEAEGFRRLAAQYLSQHTVSERQLDMIFVMGSEGYSERIQVAKHLNLSNSTLKEEFVHLAQEGLIEQEEISLDGKTFIHRLSPLGVGVYLAQQFDEKAPLVYSEMECIIQDHQNVHHGYFIKDTKYRLSEQGFLHVTDDRKSNTREVAGGKLYIADITGVNPVTNEMWYIECEHVTQSHKELTEKLLKAAQVTSRLYVVVPSKEEGERFEKFYLEYVTILLSHNRKPLPVMLATRRQFKKQEFQELQLEELSLRYPDEAAAYRKKHPPFKPKPGDDE